MDHAIELWGQPSLTFSLTLLRSLLRNLTPPAVRRSLSLIAQSLLFAYANNSCRSSARWPISSGLWPSATLMSWNPPPLRSTLIDVCLRKHQWRRSVPGFQLNSVCHINNQCMETYPRTPTAKTPHEIPTKNSNEKFQQKSPTKNSNTLENGLVPPCSILLILFPRVLSVRL